MIFVINSLTSWNEPHRARHQVTNGLLEFGYRVVFIEKNRAGMPRLSIEENSPEFAIITPFFFIGYKLRYRIPILNEIYQAWLFKRVRSLYGDQLVINFDFTSTRIKKYFPRTVYYCNDEQIGNSDYGNLFVNWYHRRCEISVIRKSSLAITTSPYLTGKLAQYNKKVYEIPLGAPDPDKIPQPLTARKRSSEVIIGLVGFISLRKISYTLINKLIEHEGFRIVLIGPVESSFINMIKDLSKVSQLGILKGDALFIAIQDFDVAIAPYEMRSINPGTTSNKLYQYLACGVPVVITAIPNLDNIDFPEGSVYKVLKEDEFIPAVRAAANSDRIKTAALCKEFASRNSWTIRVRAFIGILQQNKLIK